MEHNYNDIDELFQKSFENFEVEPPSELKALIDKQIQVQRKRRFGKIWFLGIILLALISSASLFFLNNKKQNLHAQKVVTTSNNSHELYPSKLDETTKKSSNKSNSQVDKNFNQSKTEKDKFKTEKINSKISNNLETKVGKTYNSIQTKKEKNNSSNKFKKQQKTKKIKIDLIENFEKLVNTKENNKHDEDLIVLTKPNDILKDSVIHKSNPDIDTNQLSQNTSVKLDSSQNNSDSKNPINNKRNLPLLLSFKTDYLSPLFNNSNSEEFISRNSFHFQLEGSFLFSKKFGASSGINYFSSSQIYTKSQSYTDSTLIGFTTDYIFDDSTSYIYDSNNMIVDSVIYSFIIDSIQSSLYEFINKSSSTNSLYTISSFSVPLFIYFNQKLSNNIYLDLNTGAILNFQKIRFTDTSNPLNSDLTLSKIGIKAILKTSLRYQFSQFGVSLNTNFLYDLSPTKTATFKRNVLNWGIGVGASWRF